MRLVYCQGVFASVLAIYYRHVLADIVCVLVLCLYWLHWYPRDIYPALWKSCMQLVCEPVW